MRTKIRRSRLWRCRGELRITCLIRRRKEICERSERMTKSISRRDVLRSLGMGAMAGSVLRVILMQAAEYAHNIVQAEKALSPGGYTPKFFPPHQYKILHSLWESINRSEYVNGVELKV